VAIDYQDARTRQYVGSPSLAALPDGRYVASHDVFGPGSAYRRTRVFRSADKGRTWRHLKDLTGQFWSGLFVHRGALYLMGTSKRYGVVVIRRSTDGGATWTDPEDATTGRLTDEPIYHTAPVPVVVHRGRLWRAMEVRTRRGPKRFGALVMSAPVEADLLAAENWRLSNTIFFDPAWREGVRHWREGNVVVTPEGALANIIRTDPRPGIAAVLDVSEDGKTVAFDPETGLIDFIGGAVKFTIRFDPETRRYWTLASKQTDPPATRNVLVLTSSADLRHWRLECHVLVHLDRKHHAFQYIDWLFEGDDLIAVSRTAWDGSHNFHDANYLTFHRIRRFRDRTIKDPSLNAAVPRPERKAPWRHLVAAWDFERGRGGPLADKAPAGASQDGLKLAGKARVADGVAVIPRGEVGALEAADSHDLSPAAELTAYARVRVDRNPPTFVSLVGKRQFKDPERRSYGLFIAPDQGREDAFGIGGQLSTDGTSRGSLTAIEGEESLPVGRWVEVAMTLRREPVTLTAEWWARTGKGPWRRVNGPVSRAGLSRLSRAPIPLLLGNNANLRAHAVTLELDEVRLYDRALTLKELAGIAPGRLSQ
jgi:hypothetical protein